MEESTTEKKRSLWPWVIVAIIIIGAIIAWIGLTNTRETKEVQTQTESPKNAEGGPVAEYIQFINEGSSMGLDHQFTNNALLKLTNAIYAKAQQTGYDVKANMEQVREHADHITQDPFETTHANSIRKAADILTNAMENMQKSKYPGLNEQVNEVRNAANNINPDILTLDQRDAVKSFFKKSADLLQAMK